MVLKAVSMKEIKKKNVKRSCLRGELYDLLTKFMEMDAECVEVENIETYRNLKSARGSLYCAAYRHKLNNKISVIALSKGCSDDHKDHLYLIKKKY